MPCRAQELVARRALPERETRHGEVLVVPWLAFPASSSCRGLVLRAVVPVSSSCRGLALFGWPSRQAPPARALAQMLCSWMAQKEGPRRVLAIAWQALPRGATTVRAQVRDTKVPLL